MPLSPAVIPELRRLLGPDGLVVTPEGRMTYECDMHTFYKGTPELVALPRTTAQVMELVRLCRRERVAGAGELARRGGKVADRPGYDLTGVAVGSEGTLGVVTAVTVRLLHTPEGVRTALAAFASIEDASEAVSAIIAAGIVPAALEMLDAAIIRAINEGIHAGYPTGAAAVLLIERDGPQAEVAAQA